MEKDSSAWKDSSASRNLDGCALDLAADASLNIACFDVRWTLDFLIGMSAASVSLISCETRRHPHLRETIQDAHVLAVNG